MGLPCMNCKKDVPQDEAKLFAQCFVCPDCFTMAERIVEHGQRELQQLLTTLKELVRLAIVRGELSFSELPPDMPTTDRTSVIDAIAELARKKEDECPTPRRRSTRKRSRKTTRRPAVAVDGSASSDSTEDADSNPGTSSTPTPPTEPSDNA